MRNINRVMAAIDWIARTIDEVVQKDAMYIAAAIEMIQIPRLCPHRRANYSQP